LLTTYNVLGENMNLYKKYKNEFICKIYIFDEEYIKTYGVIEKEKEFYKIYIDKFNYMAQGEKLVEKLRGRGYISVDEISYYNINDIKEIKKEPINIKTKLKTIFQRRR